MFVRSCTIILLVGALAACTESADNTAFPVEAVFNESANSSGATIVRSEETFQLALYDAENQLLAFHNFRNAFPACGTPATEFRLADVMDVISGSDATLVHELFTAEAFIWVWHSTTGSIVQARCTVPIAKGVGKLVYTDNDLMAFLGDRARANSFGFTAQARLTDANGKEYHYNGISRVKWQPNSDAPDQRFQEVARINLQSSGQ